MKHENSNMKSKPTYAEHRDEDHAGSQRLVIVLQGDHKQTERWNQRGQRLEGLPKVSSLCSSD